MPIDPTPGEVWFADLGLVEKSRPVLILAYPETDDARSLVIVAPLTSQIRGLRGEVDLGHLAGYPNTQPLIYKGSPASTGTS